jgi:GAF domain-containing protein
MGEQRQHQRTQRYDPIVNDLSGESRMRGIDEEAIQVFSAVSGTVFDLDLDLCQPTHAPKLPHVSREEV